ncbi:hypothetical protein ABEB36_014114 [Hypothenemus hampei]|uniref:MADF domain-containing protein n=1 Tax=Hypothenemus hampei TaxID=57062 RepID=A0ABD1E7X7_HYPHA
MSAKRLPDDEKFNISFVQAVEKQPCLYDNTLKTYSDRNVQDKAWNQIAGLYLSIAAECKKKWKILRGGLTRYIKQRSGKSGCSTKSIKKYYLWDVMQFVLPYTKSRPQSGNLPITEEEMFENADSIENETENLSTVESETPPFDHISQADIDHENFSSTPSTSSMLSTSTTPSTSTTSSKKKEKSSKTTS